jgi:U3 small nucleolar RNA-associated protein 5
MSTKRKAPGKLAAPVVKPSARPATKAIINEARTSVADTGAIPDSAVETIEISSDADSDVDISDAEPEVAADQANGDQAGDGSVKNSGSDLNGRARARLNAADDASPNEAEAEGSDGEATSPSFGELLRGNETIDVPSLLQQGAAENSVAKSSRAGIRPPALQSLTTVLTQALRTDDTDLLESCLHSKDLPTIRNTIERLDSTLAGTLLNKIAARLYRRPGRAGVLMTWIQWTLIAHGGALASQPKVIHGLNGLQKVLAERAKGLSSLLALKGKLDLLEGQMDMRRKMQYQSGAIGQGDNADEDADVIWVEGEPNDSDEEETLGGLRRGRDMDIDDEDNELAANGFIDDSEDDEDEEDVVEEDDDDAAEESLDEDEVDHDDVESIAEDEESDVEAAPPSKVQKTAKSFSKRK